MSESASNATEFVPDPDIGLPLVRCRNRQELLATQQGDGARRRYALEVYLAYRHRQEEEFGQPGYCLLDERSVDFAVDRLYAPPPVDADWLSKDGSSLKVDVPNWRERLICPICGLNNRQRAIAVFAARTLRQQQAALAAAGIEHRPRFYLTEQVTATYRHFVDKAGEIEVIGSEFLAPELPSGTIRDGLRHENIEATSFATGSLDIVLSSSVLEHVADPMAALSELGRILRPAGAAPGGELLLEIPFDIGKEETTTRAQLVDGELVHLLPPAYHGDPLSEDGVLVFTDFGWDLLDHIREEGYFEIEMILYWSLVFGHLGPAQFFFRAVRTERPWRG